MDWLRAEEVKITTSKRIVQKAGETVEYEFENEFKIIFDSKGNLVNYETFGDISEEELKEGTKLVKKMLFGK